MIIEMALNDIPIQKTDGNLRLECVSDRYSRNNLATFDMWFADYIKILHF